MHDENPFGTDEERNKLTEAFLAKEAPLPHYQIADFQPLIGTKFSVTNIIDEAQGELLLESLEEYPENKTRRKSIRRFPFSLTFTRAEMTLLPSGYYKLRSGDPEETAKVLFIKPLDFHEPDEVNVYEAVIN